MDALRIVWKRLALRRVDEISSWYAENMGITAARHFLEGIENTVLTLAHSPHVGTLDERRSNSKIKYYSFLSHPKYRIIYYFNSRTIYVVTIYRALMRRG